MVDCERLTEIHITEDEVIGVRECENVDWMKEWQN